MATGFRFGINMAFPGSRSEWVDKVRRAEALGYDSLLVADHLGMLAPFPRLSVAAEVTERITLGTLVLNTPFYNPTLLARDVAALDQFSGGRLELGLGAGYVKDEFDATGIPMPGPGARIEHVVQTVRTLRTLYADPNYQPAPTRPEGPRILIGGTGNRILRIAAQHADVIALPGAVTWKTGVVDIMTADELDERADYLRGLLGERSDQVELNLQIYAVAGPDERYSVGDMVRQIMPGFTDERIRNAPSILVGKPQQIADTLREYRTRYGITYFTIVEPYLETFAPVIELLK
ncbi:TIGR03621 family F420-dependent LLM class oxidoreductase [Nocardia vulneris]|uniref:TIGR03621 family F420-dependent LLM class oxidoreductase n=1 Tax=Nocardia vulneris TaxID=1141657 RepID=UPI0030CC4FC6